MREISENAAVLSESALDEAANLLRKIAGNRRADESMKGVLLRVRRVLLQKLKPQDKRWSSNRVAAIWYRDERVRVRAEELAELRALAAPTVEADPLAELHATIERLAKYEPLLERLDAEFHGPQISAARDQISQASRLLGRRRVRA
ncbi:MAG: hypothetical protein CL533_04325 [Afipia sp.]|nr:hypothetical protein [Afipia sp.]OUX62335.1 MAG: hypothetical protein CBB64_04305 [Afipia sp. TMED4]HAQ92735.1 hypothetical protein [Afipia sp.]HBF53327.1 hypothetical protein [Afipia sp.]HCX19057.1 hypothetical protein [Afipia sp.]